MQSKYFYSFLAHLNRLTNGPLKPSGTGTIECSFLGVLRHVRSTLLLLVALSYTRGQAATLETNLIAHSRLVCAQVVPYFLKHLVSCRHVVKTT
jgi:hypothetical protein